MTDMQTKEQGTQVLCDQEPASLPSLKPARAARKQAAGQMMVAPPVSPMEMIQSAVNNGMGIEYIEKLMELAERMRKRDAEQGFVTAMTNFKRNQPRVQKTRTASVRSDKGNFAYKYANLADVCEAVIQRLAEFGISHDWSTAQQNGTVEVTCTLTHELGHSKSTKLSAGLDMSGAKNALQGLGSAVSYLERYTLLAACGIAVDDEQDNDGATITGDERKELQGAAADMRKDSKAPPTGLLAIANETAEGGTAKFGPWWKSITQEQRTALLPNLDALQKKAAAATASAK